MLLYVVLSVYQSLLCLNRAVFRAHCSTSCWLLGAGGRRAYGLQTNCAMDMDHSYCRWTVHTVIVRYGRLSYSCAKIIKWFSKFVVFARLECFQEEEIYIGAAEIHDILLERYTLSM